MRFQCQISWLNQLNVNYNAYLLINMTFSIYFLLYSPLPYHKIFLTNLKKIYKLFNINIPFNYGKH